MTRRLTLSALFFCGLSACSGRVLDLDQVGNVAPTAADSDPGLPDRANGLTSIWVDDQRLYWEAGGVLQSCLKADCKRTTLRYPTPDDGFRSAVVAGGSVYWVSLGGVVYSCPAEGCSAPATVVVEDGSSSFRVFAHRNYLYWSSAVDIYRCPASGCPATPEVVAANATGDALVFDETHVYWMNGLGISSAPLDGSEAHERLIEIPYASALAVRHGYLYWTVRDQVFRCAIASCDASPPTLLATASSDISALEVDDTTVYWLAANSLQACPLAGCEQSQQLTPARVFEYFREPTFSIDAKDVYWIESRDPHDSRKNVLRKTTM